MINLFRMGILKRKTEIEILSRSKLDFFRCRQPHKIEGAEHADKISFLKDQEVMCFMLQHEFGCFLSGVIGVYDVGASFHNLTHLHGIIENANDIIFGYDPSDKNVLTFDLHNGDRTAIL